MISFRPMRTHAVAFPFFLIAAATTGWHGCQPSGSAKGPAAAATPASAASCGVTLLYQNNNNGEIEPCG